MRQFFEYITIKHTTGMLIIGTVVWVFYIMYLMMASSIGIDLYIAEILGVPATITLNYYLNLKLNYQTNFRWVQLISFTTFSVASWVVFVACTYIFHTSLGLSAFYSLILAIAIRTAFNVTLQQVVTFGLITTQKLFQKPYIYSD